MRLVLLVVFIVFPLLEIALLVKLGAILGFWPTIGLVIATAIAGTTILHRQGFAVLRRSQEAIAEGKPPIEPVADGVFLLISGLLLITPGLITDSIGILLLVPPVRKAIARWSLRKILSKGNVAGGVFTQSGEAQWRNPGPASRPSARQSGSRRPSPGSDAPIIEGEFERLDETAGTPSQSNRKPPAP
jgi:UPF0716 protein FxsA